MQRLKFGETYWLEKAFSKHLFSLPPSLPSIGNSIKNSFGLKLAWRSSVCNYISPQLNVLAYQVKPRWRCWGCAAWAKSRIPVGLWMPWGLPRPPDSSPGLEGVCACACMCICVCAHMKRCSRVHEMKLPYFSLSLCVVARQGWQEADIEDSSQGWWTRSGSLWDRTRNSLHRDNLKDRATDSEDACVLEHSRTL